MLAEPSEVTHRWERTHTCLFTPRSKLRRLCCPLLNSKYSRRDSISIYKEIKYPLVTISCQTSDKVKGSYRKNRSWRSFGKWHCAALLDLHLFWTLCWKTDQNEYSKPSLPFSTECNEPVFMQWSAIKANKQTRKPKPATFSFPSHVPVKFTKCGHFQLWGPCCTFLYSSHNCLTKTLW